MFEIFKTPDFGMNLLIEGILKMPYPNCFVNCYLIQVYFIDDIKGGMQAKGILKNGS